MQLLQYLAQQSERPSPKLIEKVRSKSWAFDQVGSNTSVEPNKGVGRDACIECMAKLQQAVLGILVRQPREAWTLKGVDLEPDRFAKEAFLRPKLPVSGYL